MTKLIRIENADISNYKVKVKVMERNSLGDDFLISETELSSPTMLDSFYIHSSRYLIVEEY